MHSHLGVVPCNKHYQSASAVSSRIVRLLALSKQLPQIKLQTDDTYTSVIELLISLRSNSTLDQVTLL